jgi:hypothetical protein
MIINYSATAAATTKATTTIFNRESKHPVS